MTLNPHPHHPGSGCYVLKLHRHALPQLGRLSGRLEHIVSDGCVNFASSEELLAWLQQHAAQLPVTYPSP